MNRGKFCGGGAHRTLRSTQGRVMEGCLEEILNALRFSKLYPGGEAGGEGKGPRGKKSTCKGPGGKFNIARLPIIRVLSVVRGVGPT